MSSVTIAELAERIAAATGVDRATIDARAIIPAGRAPSAVARINDALDIVLALLANAPLHPEDGKLLSELRVSHVVYSQRHEDGAASAFATSDPADSLMADLALWETLRAVLFGCVIRWPFPSDGSHIAGIKSGGGRGTRFASIELRHGPDWQGDDFDATAYFTLDGLPETMATMPDDAPSARIETDVTIGGAIVGIIASMCADEQHETRALISWKDEARL
jgi:hypothetical protein